MQPLFALFMRPALGAILIHESSAQDNKRLSENTSPNK